MATRLTPILLGLTFVMSVVTMVLVLLLFVTKPWDDPITEAELSEILRAEQETSSEEKEAERKTKCDSAKKILVLSEGSLSPEMGNRLFTIILENDCFGDLSFEEILDMRDK